MYTCIYLPETLLLLSFSRLLGENYTLTYVPLALIHPPSHFPTFSPSPSLGILDLGSVQFPLSLDLLIARTPASVIRIIAPPLTPITLLPVTLDRVPTWSNIFLDLSGHCSLCRRHCSYAIRYRCCEPRKGFVDTDLYGSSVSYDTVCFEKIQRETI